MKRKIAVPLSNNQLSKHFGRAEYFKIIDTENKSIIGTSLLKVPDLEHGTLPKWIADKGITHIISGGIGQKAMASLQELNIPLVYGAEVEELEILVEKFLENKLQSGLNLCDH